MPEENLTARRARRTLLRANDPAPPTRSSATSGARRSCRRSGSGSTSRRGSCSSRCIPTHSRRARARSSCARWPSARRTSAPATCCSPSAVPRYLWPGVDIANTRAGMLLETLGFERDWVGNEHDDRLRRSDALPRPGIVVEREDRFGRARFRSRGVSRTGYPSSTAPVSSARRSRRVTPTAPRSDSAATP